MPAQFVLEKVLQLYLPAVLLDQAVHEVQVAVLAHFAQQASTSATVLSLRMSAWLCWHVLAIRWADVALHSTGATA
jgi:hypothetical protein